MIIVKGVVIMFFKQFFTRFLLITSLVSLFSVAFLLEWELQVNVALAYDDGYKVPDFSENPVQILLRVERGDEKTFDVSYRVAAKGKIETMVRQSDTPATIIRSASVYGLGDRYFEIILGISYWSFPFAWLPGGGERIWQPLWVEDLARCIVAAVNRPDLMGKTVSVAGE